MRILRLMSWVLRERTVWSIALLIFLVLVFSLTSTVVRSSAGPLEPPEQGVENVLDSTSSHVIRVAYPFLFPLVSILATLGLAVPRESGAFSALQPLGLRRWEIVLAHSLAVLVIALVPALVALLVLPPFVEPALAASGRVVALYPPGYWLAMPRLFLAILFLTLFAAAFALFFRRPGIAFGTMIAFFFVGWYLSTALGTYSIFAPPPAFITAYGLQRPRPGVLLDPNFTFTLYLLSAMVVFLAALLYTARRGELA